MSEPPMNRAMSSQAMINTSPDNVAVNLPSQFEEPPDYIGHELVFLLQLRMCLVRLIFLESRARRKLLGACRT